jgi:hypothetical protein
LQFEEDWDEHDFHRVWWHVLGVWVCEQASQEEESEAPADSKAQASRLYGKYIDSTHIPLGPSHLQELYRQAYQNAAKQYQGLGKSFPQNQSPRSSGYTDEGLAYYSLEHKQWQEWGERRTRELQARVASSPWVLKHKDYSALEKRLVKVLEEKPAKEGIEAWAEPNHSPGRFFGVDRTTKDPEPLDPYTRACLETLKRERKALVGKMEKFADQASQIGLKKEEDK